MRTAPWRPLGRLAAPRWPRIHLPCAPLPLHSEGQSPWPRAGVTFGSRSRLVGQKNGPIPSSRASLAARRAGAARAAQVAGQPIVWRDREGDYVWIGELDWPYPPWL